MNKFFKKLIGLDKLEEEVKAIKEAAAADIKAADIAKLQAEESVRIAKQKAEEEQEKARIAALSPKDRATELKQPYVAVTKTHVQEQNLNNGFFELDWNDLFILELKVAGYYGETDEEIVDAWFTALCSEIGKSAGIPVSNRSNYINVNKLDNGKIEIS